MSHTTRPSTKPEWETYGEILRRVDEAKQWAIGDWLVDGKRHYGDGLYKRAAEITGQSQGTLQNYASVSSQFEFSRRREDLGYSHHCEVASIKLIEKDKDGKLFLSDDADMEKIAELLAEAEKKGWSVVELRKAVQAYKEWQRQHIAAMNEPERSWARITGRRIAPDAPCRVRRGKDDRNHDRRLGRHRGRGVNVHA